MTIVDGMTSGFFQAISIGVLPYLMAGAVFGLVIGVIPGLSGHFAMAMAVTFLYSMERCWHRLFIGSPFYRCSGRRLTAILFNTPALGKMLRHCWMGLLCATKARLVSQLVPRSPPVFWAQPSAR